MRAFAISSMAEAITLAASHGIIISEHPCPKPKDDFENFIIKEAYQFDECTFIPKSRTERMSPNQPFYVNAPYRKHRK